MLTPRQNHIAYEALLNMLKASGVIVKDAQPDWPMLIYVANEYTDHLNQVKDKPAVEPMDPQQIYKCDSGCRDQMVVYPGEDDPNVIAFVCESIRGQNRSKESALLTRDDARRLRNQLNQLLGE